MLAKIWQKFTKLNLVPKTKTCILYKLIIVLFFVFFLILNFPEFSSVGLSCAYTFEGILEKHKIIFLFINNLIKALIITQYFIFIIQIMINKISNHYNL